MKFSKTTTKSKNKLLGFSLIIWGEFLFEPDISGLSSSINLDIQTHQDLVPYVLFVVLAWLLASFYSNFFYEYGYPFENQNTRIGRLKDYLSTLKPNFSSKLMRHIQANSSAHGMSEIPEHLPSKNIKNKASQKIIFNNLFQLNYLFPSYIGLSTIFVPAIYAAKPFIH